MDAADRVGCEGHIAVSKPAVFPSQGDNTSEIEEGTVFAPRFDADGLIPVVAVSASTGEVLMLAYMNADALALTIETGEAHYWSRSRGKLWRKGETSGNTHRVVELRTDCDQDALLLKVEMPHRAEVVLLSRRARGRGDRQTRHCAPYGRCQAALRPSDGLPSLWCRKGNLKEIGVRC
jgi:phosphoribosyl-AMP cyclohydrolase